MLCWSGSSFILILAKTDFFVALFSKSGSCELLLALDWKKKTTVFIFNIFNQIFQWYFQLHITFAESNSSMQFGKPFYRSDTCNWENGAPASVRAHVTLVYTWLTALLVLKDLILSSKKKQKTNLFFGICKHHFSLARCCKWITEMPPKLNKVSVGLNILRKVNMITKLLSIQYSIR